MTMHWLDWLIVAVPVLVVLTIAFSAQRYVHGVSDFLAAGRSAGRYLVCTALGEASMGAISIVGLFQLYYQAGFAIAWWQIMSTPVSLLMSLTGFVVYRYRETRAMTLAQFFEMRYSRRFRIFMGLLTWLSGMLNYGIFPAVGARFFVYYCGFAPTVRLGSISIPTYTLVMGVLLGCSLLFTLVGGQLTALVTDSVEGLFSGVMVMCIAGALLYLFSWNQIAEALTNVPPDQSMLHPFRSSGVRDFNIVYVLIGLAAMVYSCMAWQGNQGFNCSAASAHEARMGRVLGMWRGLAKLTTITLLALCAYTYLHHPAFAGGASQVQASLAQIPDETIRKQMQVPLALSHFLPIGIKGMFCAIMLFALFATDASYLHSWGSIFIQDVMLPLRRRPLGPQQHIRRLRWSIAGVAVFAFLFSCLFRQTDYILLFLQLTGAIYLGGAGSVIIGGLYWRTGTTAAAWAAAITGSTLAVTGIILQQVFAQFPLNGVHISGISMGCSVGVYVLVSLLTRREEFDLDRLLHRGPYAVDDHGQPLPAVARPPRSWKSLLGIDEHFTRGDKAISLSLFAWSMFWFAVFVVGSIWNLIDRWPVAWWARYWHIVGVMIPLGLGVVTTTWFTIGGVRDLRRLFRALATLRRDVHDDGTVATPSGMTEARGFPVVTASDEKETAGARG